VNDLEKEFVTYELALRMKALGFDEPCFNLYHLNRRELMYVCPNIGEVATYKYDNHNKTNHISAPTFSQTFRWFRENHFLSSDIAERMRDGKRITHFFISDLKTNNKFFKTISSKSFTDYDEAELACLTKLIEIVESKSELK
jgi:hypothetical protein